MTDADSKAVNCCAAYFGKATPDSHGIRPRDFREQAKARNVEI
jgi:hypothetical protein